MLRPLGPGGCPPISSAVTPPLGHLHLDLAGGESPVLAVHAPHLLTVIVNDVCMQRTNAFSDSVMSLLSLTFHRLSRDQDRDARTSAYHELINLMLSHTSEDKQLINVTAARLKADGPFCSNLEAQPELKKKHVKHHLQGVGGWGLEELAHYPSPDG